jgi:hypothetical protein
MLRNRSYLSSLLPLVITANAALAQSRPVPDTFTAATSNMSPAGVTLKIDVLEWSDDDARAAAVAVLTDDSDASLTSLPTVGYVWPSDSAVGYSLKYAHRAPGAEGGERITVVTDRRLGAYDFGGWTAGQPGPGAAGGADATETDETADRRAETGATADGATADTAADDAAADNAAPGDAAADGATADDTGASGQPQYSVIELYLDADGMGDGTLSLAADVAFDAEAGTVSLEPGDAANVLGDAKAEPKPYWAQGG